MLRFLIVFGLLTTPAYAAGPYCSDQMPATAITQIKNDYVLTEGYNRYVCEPQDAAWHKCDNRDDYLVHFEWRGDELWISQPSYSEGEYAKFTSCD